MFDDFPMVSALIDPDTRKWKANLVRALFLPFEASVILNIPLSHNLLKDKVIWVGNKNGISLSRVPTTLLLKYWKLMKLEKAQIGIPEYH